MLTHQQALELAERYLFLRDRAHMTMVPVVPAAGLTDMDGVKIEDLSGANLDAAIDAAIAADRALRSGVRSAA